MKTENFVLMKQAREALAGKWKLAVGTTFLYLLIGIAVQIIPEAGWLLSLIIEGPLVFGFIIFSLSLSRGEHSKVDQLFLGFHRFGTSLVAYLLTTLFITLWTLLLIVPGIIAALSYSMTFYILADNPSMGAREAIKKSKKMMDGNKWKLFCLGLRFLGWALLTILTLGIGILWLLPYIQVTTAKFYDNLKSTPATPAQPVSTTA